MDDDDGVDRADLHRQRGISGRAGTSLWPIQRLSKKRRALSWLIGFALVLIPTAALCLLWTPLNMAVCLLHLTLFWLLSDLVFALIRRLRHAAFKRYWAGVAALILSVAWLSMGWVQATRLAEGLYDFYR